MKTAFTQNIHKTLSPEKLMQYIIVGRLGGAAGGLGLGSRLGLYILGLYWLALKYLQPHQPPGTVCTR